MIHLIDFNHASPELRKLITSERTIEDDERMYALFEAIPKHNIYHDTYGPGSALAQLGLSWWRDVVPKLDENFVLSPEDCLAVVEMISSFMPPAPSKVIAAIGEGTELAYCAETYPEAQTVRDPSLPYDTEEMSTLYFRLGFLVSFLQCGSKGNGIVVSP